MSNISRRDFLKTAGVMSLAVAASAALAGCDTQTTQEVVKTVTDAADAAETGYKVTSDATSITMGSYKISLANIKKYYIVDGNKDAADIYGKDLPTDEDEWKSYKAGKKGNVVVYGDEFVVADIAIEALEDGVPNEFLANLTLGTSNLSNAMYPNNGTAVTDNTKVKTYYLDKVATALNGHGNLTVDFYHNTHDFSSWNGTTVVLTRNSSVNGGLQVRINGTQDVKKGKKLHALAAWRVVRDHIDYVNENALQDTSGNIVVVKGARANITYKAPSITLGVQSLAANQVWTSVGTLTASIPEAEGINASNLLGNA